MDHPNTILKQIYFEHIKNVSKEPTLDISLNDLEEFELMRLENKSDSLVKVGFFIPTEGFEGNFGNLPKELESRGYKSIWLYGSSSAYLKSKHSNKFLIINDMCRRIKGLDAIVTSSVMDCLPKETLRVLHDHISFAPFDLEAKLHILTQNSNFYIPRFDSLRQVFSEISAFVVFVPFYDLILTPSESISHLTKKSLQLLGYSNSAELINNNIRTSLNNLSSLVDISSYRDTIDIAQTGYCKLDEPILSNLNTSPNNTIIFAPTHRDAFGNTDGTVWSKALTTELYSIDLLKNLCEKFINYKIVFKPFKDDINSNNVNSIRKQLSAYSNFEIDECGSNYWPLYSKADFLISDFSSTAYTFALGTGRPVIFFSPDENNMPNEITNSTYCLKRSDIGLIESNIPGVLNAASTILTDYDYFLDKVSKFRNINLIRPGYASITAATVIDNILLKRRGLNSPNVDLLDNISIETFN
jgi:hypothetical protein